MKRNILIALTLAVVGLAACGDSQPPVVEAADATKQSIENAMMDACRGHGGVENFAMATHKIGYGSGTDYWLVRCADRHVARVEI